MIYKTSCVSCFLFCCWPQGSSGWLASHVVSRRLPASITTLCCFVDKLLSSAVASVVLLPLCNLHCLVLLQSTKRTLFFFPLLLPYQSYYSFLLHLSRRLKCWWCFFIFLCALQARSYFIKAGFCFSLYTVFFSSGLASYCVCTPEVPESITLLFC